MSYFVKRKNKQYQIEKGLLLFTQPKSPYFYGKIRHNKKYLTKSFAPITDKQEAIYELYNWKSELLSETKSTALPYKNGVYTLTSVANIKNIKAKVILIGISLLPFGITNLNNSFSVLSGVKILSFEENASAFFIVYS